jgi:hypothetical protein
MSATLMASENLRGLKMPKVTCLCGREECSELTLEFRELGDQRGNYIRLPKAMFRHDLRKQVNLIKEKLRQVEHATDRIRKKTYVSLIHFHPSFLDPADGLYRDVRDIAKHRSLPLKKVVSKSFLAQHDMLQSQRKGGLYSGSDKWEIRKVKDEYTVLPYYRLSQVRDDLVRMPRPPITTIPEEVLGHILSYIGEGHFRYIAATSKVFNEIYTTYLHYEKRTSFQNSAGSISCAKVFMDECKELPETEKIRKVRNGALQIRNRGVQKWIKDVEHGLICKHFEDIQNTLLLRSVTGLLASGIRLAASKFNVRKNEFNEPIDV